MEYMNYHKHDTMSSILGMPDSATKNEEFIKKAVEYGHSSYFTTNHGTMGDIFESFSLCQQYGLNCYVGLEGYIVENASLKDDRNYHIILIPKNEKGRKKLNLINSHAHMYGYYRKPRIDLSELLTMNPKDIFITTACEMGILRDKEGFNNIFKPLYKHFKDNIFLEVQNHLSDSTIEYVERSLKIQKMTGLGLIAANDSHAVDKAGLERRKQLLLGKHISYGNEDNYILDYPDYETMFSRFEKQHILNNKEIQEAMDNTLIFKQCEPLILDYEIKMPTIYPTLTPQERIEKLKKIISSNFKKIIKEDQITKEEYPKYKEGIRQEMKIIEDTNEVCHTADYFLLNTRIVDLAVNKYGGTLTRTGRGSCGSFYINRILGMTQLDRFRVNLPAFPDRFMSVNRCLLNRSMADIDYNISEQEPFVKATRELLGEHSCYPMIAYGTLKESEAFRNVCRSHNLEFAEFNEVGKDLSSYQNDKKWGQYIKESQQYIGIEVSASVHPCAHLLSNKNILEEYGIIKCGDNLCVMLTSSEADQFKLLKNDYLIVSVWKLIKNTCELADIPIPSFNHLLEYIKTHPNIWKIIDDGMTCTINQIDTDNGKKQAQEYKPRSIEDMAMLAAAIRPSFDSWRNQFLQREYYTTGSQALDNVLNLTGGYILFQENLMQYFEWLGVSPAESISLIKKISKKKIKAEDFEKLESQLYENWIKQTGSNAYFNETWNMIQSCMAYGFCSMHGLATGGDACYGLYLKQNYPLEYFTSAFNLYKNDERKTNILKSELNYFSIKLESIKFGFSKGDYSFNKTDKTIYKGIGGIKYLNDTIANELYKLGQKSYSSFIDLVIDIKSTSVNSKQLDILIKLDFFSDFGSINNLLQQVSIFNELYGKKQFKIEKLIESKYNLNLFKKYAVSITEKIIKLDDSLLLIKDICKQLPVNETSIFDKIKYQNELYGYIQLTIPTFDSQYAYVQSIYGKSNKIVSLYRICDGTIETVKVREKVYKNNEFQVGDIIKTIDCYYDKKWRYNDRDSSYYQIDEKELILTKWSKVEDD